jgi:hypothetical protein
MAKIKSLTTIHPNVTVAETDSERLTSTLLTAAAEDGFEFEARTEEVDVDNI